MSNYLCKKDRHIFVSIVKGDACVCLNWMEVCSQCGKIHISDELANAVELVLNKKPLPETTDYQSTEISQRAHDALSRIAAQREEIIEAFLSKYGLDPADCVLVSQHTFDGEKFWIEKKDWKERTDKEGFIR